jgi:Ca2+:H+ antiporter
MSFPPASLSCYPIQIVISRIPLCGYNIPQQAPAAAPAVRIDHPLSPDFKAKAREQSMKALFKQLAPLDYLLILVPVAAAMEYVFHAEAIYIFLTSGLAIVPLASLMGRATEELANRLGEGVGGLLNATFGNAAELIIGLFALREGLLNLVKASITGSIIGNLLLVFGFSVVVGGVRYPVLRFNRTAASLGSSMLLLSAAALVVPAIHYRIIGGSPHVAERELSLEIAVVLIVTYAVSLIFTLKTHRQLYSASHAAGQDGKRHEQGWGSGTSAIVLLVSTGGIAWMSEFLVGAAREAAASLGMNDIFAGVILIAIIGNAAEHSTAVMMAHKNRMDVSINIALGSSMQIALFVAPVLVFASYFIAPAPMDLLFSIMEVIAVVLAVSAIAFIVQDGESNWMEGVQLLAVYLILGIAFYNLPQ